MDRPLTIKQEKFCQAILTEANNSDAYRAAYNTGRMKPESIHRKAKEVMDNVKIGARIKQLRDMQAEKAIVTAEDIAADLYTNMKMARELDQMTAANGAAMGRAKLLGLVIDKQQIEAITSVELEIDYGTGE